MSLFLCSICGHIAFDGAPDNCPVCHAPKERFAQKDNIFTESEEKSPEAGVKHKPLVSIDKNCKLFEGTPCVDITARIGEVVHPMEEKHFINFIDFYVDKVFVKRASLTPALYAAACAHLKVPGKTVTVVERCNIHGWWMTEMTI